MAHHQHFLPVVGIPNEHLREVCKLGHAGACRCLDFSPADQVRVCAKGIERITPAGHTATGTQYDYCTGAPEYRAVPPPREDVWR